MAGRSDIEAGKAHVTLYAKQSGLTQGIKAAMGGAIGVIKQSAAVMSGILGADLIKKTVSELQKGLTHFANFGRELKNMSDRTGMAAGALAELKFAAEQSGAGIGDVESAIADMQSKGFRASQFDMLAQQIASIKDPALRAAQATAIFGASGKKLLPMFAELKSLKGQAKSLGLAPSGDEVSRANSLWQAFNKLGSILSASVFKLGAAIEPILRPMIEGAVKLIAKFNEWAFTNNVVIDTIKAIGGALSKGDLKLAAEIAMGSVQVAFEIAKLEIVKIWEAMKLRVLSIIDEIRIAMAPSIAYIGSLWDSFATYVSGVFAAINVVVQEPWNNFKLAASGAITAVMAMVQQLIDALNKMFLGLVAGFNVVLQQIATISKTAMPLLGLANSSFAQDTGFDISAALQKAKDASDAARQNARPEAEARQAGRDAEAEKRIQAQRDHIAELEKALAGLREKAILPPKKQEAPGGAAGDFIAKGGVASTFSAAALIAQAGTGSVQDRIARNTERAAKALEVIESRVQTPSSAGRFI